ncbi:uncharacterized protein GLRG_00475 [Colletotrichum graminicola M1.001]|uniref:Uncharacterized protein n=1 Tax=Colletotrichum graminicola (strain M1.001 / M2 / FGSC 10212) TaxID=645133 RepID=E3Q419_COLGM|nr:uncharacterized protein GLRG_00475 [Colletotrichum graminicola M1.001]EFQ25331.1 hypothetical protein GLRG_00475 [Colletotrichum graminicola M1.001]
MTSTVLSLPRHIYLTWSALRRSGAGSQNPSNDPLRTPAGIRRLPSSTSAATWSFNVCDLLGRPAAAAAAVFDPKSCSEQDESAE